MCFRPLDQLAKVIENAFGGATKVRKNFKTFFIEAMILFIAIPKRVNFTQIDKGRQWGQVPQSFLKSQQSN